MLLCTTFCVSLWIFCIVFLDIQPRALFFCGAGLWSPCTESSYLIWGKSEGITQESLSQQVLSHCRLSTSSSPGSLLRVVQFYYNMLEISWNEHAVTIDNCLLVYFFSWEVLYLFQSLFFFSSSLYIFCGWLPFLSHSQVSAGRTKIGGLGNTKSNAFESCLNICSKGVILQCCSRGCWADGECRAGRTTGICPSITSACRS